MLTDEQLQIFRTEGHLTVPEVFATEAIDRACREIETWSDEFLDKMAVDQRKWYLEPGTSRPVLRKLDNPVFYRETFQSMARHATLVEIATQILGEGVCVFFSQLFLKPPEIGGPKPVHQDNYYFGPEDTDALLTVWVALDEATTENGCLCYANGSHHDGVLPHLAPENEPFNLQVDPEIASRYSMSPAPVPCGGVSLHHGNTLHQSSANRSNRPRRALAMHYLRNATRLTQPALPYDEALRIEITSSPGVNH